MTFSWCQEGRVNTVIVQLEPNAGLTSCQNRTHRSPSRSGCFDKDRCLSQAMFQGDTKTTLTSLKKNCDLGTWRTVPTTETNGGRIRLQREGTGGTRRDPARGLGIKTVALHIFHGSPRHSPRETQGGGESLISNIGCTTLLRCTRNSVHSLLALLPLILKTQLAKNIGCVLHWSVFG